MSKTILSKLLLVMMVLLLLNGCLTSLRPFYLSEQIIEDSRILGTYKDERAGHVWKVERSSEHRGHYVATLSQRESWSKYLLTLFKFNDRTYLDIFPERDSSLAGNPGGPPTMSQILRGLTMQPLHLLVEVEVADEQLTLGVISRIGAKTLKKVRPSVRLLGEEGVVPVPYTTKELQGLLAEIGGKNTIFDEKMILKKDLATISRPVASHCAGCGHSFTVMSADAEDRGETWRVRCPSCGYQYDQSKDQSGDVDVSSAGMKLLEGSTLIQAGSR